MKNGKRAKVNTEYDVPYGAGVSEDGTTIYIDRRIPKSLVIGGYRISVHDSIELHETVEFAMMHFLGFSYPDAHELAEGLEDHHIILQGVNSTQYEQALQPVLETCEAEFKEVPPDLDLTPYRDSKDLKTMAKIQKLQKGTRK
jgi:hypothetical protein